jgi:hypothetical protein
MMRKRKAVISTSANGETGQGLIVGQLVKQLPEGRPMLIVILEPEDVIDTAYLVWERENMPTILAIYLTSLGRVRKLGPVEQYEIQGFLQRVYRGLRLIPYGEGISTQPVEKKQKDETSLKRNNL